MADRAATPDILKEVMFGQTTKQESKKAIKPASIKNSVTSRIESTSPKKIVASKDKDELKEKATFNLPSAVIAELEEKWMEMRRLTGSRRVSRTLIVEEALKLAFADFDQKKDSGKLYASVIKNPELSS